MDAMSDPPTREEIAARLEAAEARTETRIAQLAVALAERGASTDRKIDLLAGKIDALAGAVTGMKSDMAVMKSDTSVQIAELRSELRAEIRDGRKEVRTVGIGAVLAIMALVVALWVAGINSQANMIAVFQAGLGVRALAPAGERTTGEMAPKPGAPPAREAVPPPPPATAQMDPSGKK